MYKQLQPLSTYSPFATTFVFVVLVLATECTRYGVIRTCHGAYLPRSRSFSSYTHSSGSRLFGVCPFFRHSYSLCSPSPLRHDICFRRPSPLSSSSPHRLCFVSLSASTDFPSSAPPHPYFRNRLSASSSLRCLRSRILPCTFSTLCPSLRQSLMCSLTLRMEANNLPRWSPKKLLSSCCQSETKPSVITRRWPTSASHLHPCSCSAHRTGPRNPKSTNPDIMPLSRRM